MVPGVNGEYDMARGKNCWGCGDNLDRAEPEAVIVKDGHTYCGFHCYYAAQSGEEHPDYPRDFDESDRSAYASERIEHQRRER